MATVKKSKKKVIIPIAIILVIAIVATIVTIAVTSNKEVEVSLTKISTDSIVQTVSATGDITSGLVKDYKVSSVATVKNVYVKVGDQVKEGKLLATFDTSGLDAEVANLQESYDSAKLAYESADRSQKEAAANLKSVEAQIAAVNKQINNLGNVVVKPTTTKKQNTTKRVTTTAPQRTTREYDPIVTAPRVTTTRAPRDFTNTTEALEELIVTIENISDQITNMADSVEATNAITAIVMNAIYQEVASGNLSADAIADAVGSAMYAAIEQGMIEFVDSGVAVEAVQTAVRSIDWEAFGNGVASDEGVQMASLQAQLAALNAQKEIYKAASSTTVVKAQKGVMDSAESALNTVKAAQEELSAGWKADFDGTITACDLKKGEQTTLLTKGIRLENTNKLIVTVSLGEYDIHKVKVGMPAEIKTAYGTYTGEVATIAPTASGASDSSLVDSVGSMAGVSGLSSLTASGAGVECEITVDDPDENIIIGFEASVTIEIGTFSNVPCVPIESIILEKEGSYVYLYDEDENTVTKTKIETGASSNTSYQVISGLKVGDKIVETPSADYEEETFEVTVK